MHQSNRVPVAFHLRDLCRSVLCVRIVRWKDMTRTGPSWVHAAHGQAVLECKSLYHLHQSIFMSCDSEIV